MQISLKVLVENTPSMNQALGSEHGLSLYVETPYSRFIFDCGATGLAWRNAQWMGVDLRKVQFVVISHAHYDHAGGFPSLLERAHPARLYTGKGFWREKFSYDSEGRKYTCLGAGFDEEKLRSWEIEQVVCEKVVSLDETAWLMGDFPRREAMETIPERFVCGEEKCHDNFDDEICLVLREGNGVAVVTGCSHPGILNMVQAVHERLGLPVTSVIGGTHLKEASVERIDQTLAALKRMGLQRIAFCHCSGDLVRERLTKDAVSGCLLATGDLLEL